MTRLQVCVLFVACALCLATPTSGTATMNFGLRQTPTEEGYLVGADGVRLFYRKLGHGKDVVIFLHGGPGLNMQDGGYAMEPLAARHTLIMYDQRGGGRSDLVTDSTLLTAEGDVRDLEAVRQHFGIAKIALIGNSWGAGLALLYAVAHPDRVSRMVFLSPMPPALVPYARARSQKLQSLQAPADLARLQQIGQQADTAGDATLLAMCADIMRIVFKPYLFDSTHYARRRGDVCAEPAAAFRNAGVVGAAVNRSLGNFDLRPEMRKIRVPVLVIEGERTNVPLDGTKEWVKATPGARLLLIPKSGHAVFIDQPDALIRDLQRFLDGGWPNHTAQN